MDIYKVFLLVLAFALNMTKIYSQQSMDQYKVIFTNPPQHVPTSKTPDAPIAGNGDIGVTMGGGPDSLRFYIGKNDFGEHILFILVVSRFPVVWIFCLKN